MFILWIFTRYALYGVRAGFNISNLDFEPEVPAGIENKHRNGFALDFLQNIVYQNFSLAPEIQFSAEGAKEETLRLDYIQVPIFFKFKLRIKLLLVLDHK